MTFPALRAPQACVLPTSFVQLAKETDMATYGKKAGETVERVMEEKKHGTLKSGRAGKKVTSRKQAIAIGLSEARKAGAKVPAAKTTATRKTATKKDPG